MALLAVVLRELRLESQRPASYWARVAAGVLVALTLTSVATPVNAGAQVFSETSIIVLGLIWIVSPLLMADCLSREKREGTLDLLLLTGLSRGGIVAAKIVIGGLRAVAMILIALPVLAAAVVLGGVAGRDIPLILLHELGAMSIGLGSGLLASALSRSLAQSVIVALGLTFLLGCVFYSTFPAFLTSKFFGFALVPWTASFLFLTISAAFSAAVLELAGTNRGETKTRDWRRINAHRGLPEPSVGHCSERDPVGWIYQRDRWKMSRWLWAGGALTMVYMVIRSGQAGPELWIVIAALVLAITLAGSVSLARERQNGVLELVLVTPLSLDQILGSRIRSVWQQFSPAVFATVVPLWVSLLWSGVDVLGPHWEIASYAIVLPSSLLILPPLSVYCSLRTRTFLAGWLLACALGVALPLFLGILVFREPPADSSEIWIAALLQLAIGGAAIKRMRGWLDRCWLAVHQ